MPELLQATDALARYDQVLKSLHNSEILLALAQPSSGYFIPYDEIMPYEADFSDMVHIFFRSGLFSHGVLLSQMQNKIIVLPVVHWESKQASTLAGCWPAAYDLGTKCPKVFLKGGSAAPALVGLS